MDTQKVFDLSNSKADLEFKSQLNNDKDEFVFYEGPPFATGKPHYGHILNGILKDAICRYKNQKGYNVPRNAGWDCHGLPIENIMEKKFGLKSKKEIDNFGIGNYNSECRKMVFTCVDSWKDMAIKIGRWIDFENDYKTMDMGYMECVWNVFKKINDKGLVYRGFRVMPYSISLTTPLSNFEASSNYKMTNDICATVKFKLNSSNPVFSSHRDINILVWTTTPWTLPGNTCLAVNNDIVYQVFILNKTSEVYLCSSFYYNEKIKDKYEQVTLFTVKGSFLVGENYTPVFNYNNKIREFKIYNGDFVNSEKGTGIVHIAPAFGEDDFNLCKSNNILGDKFNNLFIPVDINGIFTNEVPAYSGVCIFDANSDICRDLKQNNLLFKKDTINHSYPFCWRSDTKLMYRAVDSWFINVEKIKDKLVENNKKVHWVPNNIGHNRFHNWLEGARDWNVSRKRYWGCTIPIWVNVADSSDYIVVGSIDSLKKLSGLEKIDDLHRDSIDNIVINKDGKRYKRIPDVFDCWFESGSMPYARNGDINNMSLKPAEFICEGLDQTRGWFYTLLVISTILDNKAPFKNVIVNGLILAEDGKKMSKKLQNYPDPTSIINKYGSDALRVYLLFSPSAYAEPLRFKDADLKVKSSNIIISLYNSIKFYKEYYSLIENYCDIENMLETKLFSKSTNMSDNWIKDKTQKLEKYISTKLDNYQFSGIGIYIQDFIENLNNIYIKLNRHRFKDQVNLDDTLTALATLKWCLHNISIIMCPFTPFLSNYMYIGLDYNTSVHQKQYSDLYKCETSEDMDISFKILNVIINNIRKFRGNNISGKYPISKLNIDLDVNITNITLDKLTPIISYIKNDCNIEDMEFRLKKDIFKTNNYRADFRKYKDLVGAKNIADALKDAKKGTLKKEYGGHIIEIGKHILRIPTPTKKIDKKTQTVSEEYGLILSFNLEFTQIIKDKFIYNQVKAAIQKFRKEQKLLIKDTHSINLYIDTNFIEYYDKILPDQLENTNILILTKRDIADKDLVSNFSVQMDNKKNNSQTIFISLI